MIMLRNEIDRAAWLYGTFPTPQAILFELGPVPSYPCYAYIDWQSGSDGVRHAAAAYLTSDELVERIVMLYNEATRGNKNR